VRIAALDLGSNSFHMIVVEARLDGTFTPLVREKEMLRLGDRVEETGGIGDERADAAIDVIRRFKAIAEAQRADELVALGTAAIREALDGSDFVDRVRSEVGVPIKVVDGTHEAELIFIAVRSSVLIDPGPALVADLGGGSLELIVGDRSEASYATSAPLGVGRLTARLEGDPPSEKELRKLRARVSDALEAPFVEINARKPRQLIVSSGTFVALVRMAAARRDGVVHDSVNQLSVTRKEIDALAAEIFSMSSSERSKLEGAEPRRSELLPAGVVVLQELLEKSRLEEVTASEWALREGIVLDAIGAHDPVELLDDPRALRRWSVMSLCRRSSWRQPHARHVAALALSLFDSTAELHLLGPDDRELLEFGALLHDIGEHVSREDHDKHTAYLIENGGLRGFSPQEIRILATIGRFHIRGTPKETFEPFAQLSEDDQSRAVSLTALLRMADGLDASHRSLVRDVRALPLGKGRKVTLLVKVNEDPGLELWSLRRKWGLLERVFAVECSVEVAPAGSGGENGAGGSGLG
jgi:exopolyphosphatase / guanosine-5'-triphosphate,3'-diphosphate pyrophosphatase